MSGIKDLQLSERQINKPLVSIITPVLNGEKYIADTVRSVLSQTYLYIEHIVIDGNSRDNTVSIVKELNPRAIVLSETDKGANDAINKGIRAASGEIVTLLNYDDYYANSNVIRKVVSMFILSPDIKVLYGKVKCIHPQTGQILRVSGKSNLKGFSFKKLKMIMEGSIMPSPATFFRKEVCKLIGFYSLKYKVCDDYEYFIRVVKQFEPYFLDEILTIMRRGGFSDRNVYQGHREVYRILRSNGINIPNALTYLFYRYAMTFSSLFLQKIGLDSVVLFYRKLKGQL